LVYWVGFSKSPWEKSITLDFHQVLRQDPGLRAGPLQLEPILAPAHQLPDAGKMGDSVMMDLGGTNGWCGCHKFGSNYSDLTRPHPKWWFSKEFFLFQGNLGW